MANTKNQPIKSKRQTLVDRMSSLYPDRTFAGQNGENGENGDETLADAILETLDSLTSSRDEGRAKNAALNKLLFSDPRAAEFVNLWIETGDPRSALVSTFGDDMNDISTDEGRARFKGELDTWRGKRAEDDRLNQEAEANWTASLEALDAWGSAKNLSEEEKVNVMLRLVGLAANGLMNKYDESDFDMAYRNMNYDRDVEQARREGEVTGRNATIDENKRRRRTARAMPPSLSGQGMVSSPRPKEPESPWAGIE